MRMVYEITAAGFDGPTDASDDLVYWVGAQSAEDVHVAIKGTGAMFHQPVLCGDLDIDFHLPRDLHAMRKVLAVESNFYARSNSR